MDRTGHDGSIIQLSSKDIYNKFINSNKNSFFTTKPFQHTPFSMDTVKEEFNNIPNFSDEVYCVLSKFGDLIQSITLEVTLPSVLINKSVDSSLIEDETGNIIVIENYMMTLDQMIEKYTLQISNFQTFTSSAMIYWRSLMALIQNSNTNYSSVISLINSFKSNHDDIHYNYSKFDYSNVKINKNIKKYNFDILSCVSTEFTAYSTSIYNADLTTTFKTVLLDYLKDYVFIQRLYVKNLVDTKIRLLKIKEIRDTENYRFAWTDYIAIALIDYIKLEIGGQVIDFQNKYTIYNHYQQNVTNEHLQLLNVMLGNIEELTTFDANKKPKTVLRVNIPFGILQYKTSTIPCFCKFQDIIVRLKVSDLENCCLFEPDDLTQYVSNININEIVSIDHACLYVQYVHLSEPERKQFALKYDEILYEQTKILLFDSVIRKESLLSLDLCNSVKDINWIIQRKNKSETLKRWTDYDLDIVVLAKVSSTFYSDTLTGKILVQLSTPYFTSTIDPDLFTNGTCEIYNSKYYNGKYKILLAQSDSLVIDLEDFIYADFCHIKLLPRKNIEYQRLELENIVIYNTNLDMLKEPSYYQHVESLKRVRESLIHKRSIALNPFDFQPSGELNFNVVKGKFLRLIFNQTFIDELTDNNDSLVIRIIGKSYNLGIKDKGFIKQKFPF